LADIAFHLPFELSELLQFCHTGTRIKTAVLLEARRKEASLPRRVHRTDDLRIGQQQSAADKALFRTPRQLLFTLPAADAELRQLSGNIQHARRQRASAAVGAAIGEQVIKHLQIQPVFKRAAVKNLGAGFIIDHTDIGLSALFIQIHAVGDA